MTFSREGWQPVQRRVEVTRDGEATASATFASGELVLSGQPFGVSYELMTGGPTHLIKREGAAPATESVPEGDYAVTFSRANWPIQPTQRVSVSADEPVHASADLRAAMVLINSEPAGAEVLSGDRVIGRTPSRLSEELPGAKTFGLRQQGNVSGQVKAGEELRLAVALNKEPTIRIPDLGITMVPISPGTFLMGSPVSESTRRSTG